MSPLLGRVIDPGFIAMTTTELSTIVHAHTCIIQGITYGFTIRRVTAGALEEPAFACALLDLEVTGNQGPRSWPVAQLSVTAPLRQPASLPKLLSCALQEHLHTSGLDVPHVDEPTTQSLAN